MHIVITRFPYESALGGEEYHTLQIAKMLLDNNCKVTFLGSCPVLLEQMSNIGCEAFELHIGKMPVTPFELTKFLLFQKIRKTKLIEKLQSIHNDSPITSLYCLSLTEKILATEFAYSHNIKCVWVEHQYIRNWLIKSPLGKKYSTLSSLVSIVPISPVNKKKLLSKLDVNPSTIVHIIHGVDCEEIQSGASNRLKGFIGASGRFHPKKGYSILLGSIKSLHDKDDTLHAEISGDGPQKADLQDLILESSMQEYCSLSDRKSRTEYIDFLNECDVFVLASVDDSETFGLVAAEAMVAGCSVVITDTCGIAEYVNEDVVQIAKAGNMQSLTDAIARALSVDESSKIRSQQYAISAFNIERMNQEYKDLLLH